MKKILSVLLCISMLATLMPTMFASAAGEDIITLPVTEDAPLTLEDKYLGSSTGYGAYQGGDDEYAWLRTSPGSERSYLVSKVALSGLAEKLGTDKVVSKVEYCTYLVGDHPDGSYAVSNSINFYSASAGWDESTITLGSWISEGFSPAIADKNGYMCEIDAVPDATIAYSFPAVSEGATPVLATFDITAAFEKAMADGIAPDSQFSFIAAFSLGGYVYPLFALSEYNNPAYRPYIRLTIENIPPLTVTTKVEPVNPSDRFEFTFSNKLSSANIWVNDSKISESDILILGPGLVFDYDYAPCATYDVKVEATDVFGQKYTKSFNFTTGGNLSSPTLDIASKDIVLSGTTLTKASFSLNTTLDASFASMVELVDENGLKVDSAAFSCDGSDVEINSAVTLESGTAYSLVIKSGAEDTNGNRFAEDFVVQSFVANPSVQFFEDADCRHELYTDNTNQTVEYLYINPDFSGMNFTVDIKNNNSSVSGYPKTIKSTMGGKIEEIASLSSGEYEISIVPMGAEEGWKQLFHLFDDTALDRLWTIMTSDDGSAIWSEWSAIADAFSLSVSSSDADYIVALCNVLGANSKPFGERNIDNLNKFRIHLTSCEILAQLNQCNSATVDEAKSLLEASFTQVQVADSAAYSKISADWTELGSKITAQYQKTAYEVYTAAAEAAKLLTCIDTVKCTATLDKLNALNHSSLVYNFVTNDDNAYYLGITDLVDDYKALASTSSVDTAVQGKGFATSGKFREIFQKAINDANENTPVVTPNKKPSYSPGNGGGFGIISSNPIAIPETGVPETGVALPFSDVANHTWAHSAIASLHAKGIIAGRGDGSFAPDDKVTRAEFAKMLVLALGIEAKATDIAFADVASSDWFAAYALTAAANGIVLGTDGSFLPNASISRQDAAVMIYRAAALAGGTMPAFTDSDSIASYARDAIASLCAAGILKGMEDGSFAPVSGLTRAQAAVMLSRIMEV